MSIFKTYITKPVKVKAARFEKSKYPGIYFIPGMEVRILQDALGGVLDVSFYLPTKDGEVRVNHGDWIIELDDGERYPCSDEVFRKKYELLETKFGEDLDD